jgi:hypothetical protein
MLTYNAYIVIPLLVWIITQTIKFLIAAFKGTINFRYFYASGGMPSVHSAVVCSLATTALILDGASSHLFGLTIIFAAIVMYDSFGVRRSSGEQAAAINMIMESLRENRPPLANPDLHLREILGHQPDEVLAGAVLGVFLAALFNINHLSTQMAWLQTTPGGLERLIYLILFAVVVIGGIIARLVIAMRWRKSTAVRGLGKALLLMSQVTGWLGLILVFCEYQLIPVLEYRAWAIVVLIGLAVWKILLLIHYAKVLPPALEAEAEDARKSKWFDFGKKKAKKKKK